VETSEFTLTPANKIHNTHLSPSLLQFACLLARNARRSLLRTRHLQRRGTGPQLPLLRALGPPLLLDVPPRQIELVHDSGSIDGLTDCSPILTHPSIPRGPFPPLTDRCRQFDRPTDRSIARARAPSLHNFVCALSEPGIDLNRKTLRDYENLVMVSKIVAIILSSCKIIDASARSHTTFLWGELRRPYPWWSDAYDRDSCALW
ncbi:hypothetical protein KC19_1G002200, partial [Ceratodon purpureus]